MRETEVSRFVGATPAEVERALTPVAVVEYEGSFEVLDVEERDGDTVVTAGGAGLRMTLRFEPSEDGLHFQQEGEAGPFDRMWTRLTWTPENEGTRVTARSGVSLGLPLSGLTDRVGTWKRRGELRRALAGLTADLE
jgi:ligand-binding SRPBCC domain-containing protein